MTRDQIISALWDLTRHDDPERAHLAADQLLLDLIDDPEVAQAYKAIERFYS